MVLVKGQTAKVKWNNGNKDWYISKGYQFTKMRKELIVKVEDLTKSAKNTVKFICDYCNEPFEKEWFIVVKSLDINKKHSCNNCSKIKMLETKKITNTLYTDKMKKAHESQRLSLKDLQLIFESKNYTLVSTEYKTNKDDLFFICNSHRSIGMQKTNATRLRRLEFNCVECQREMNFINEKQRIENTNPVDIYKKILNGDLKTFPQKFLNLKHYMI